MQAGKLALATQGGHERILTDVEQSVGGWWGEGRRCRGRRRRRMQAESRASPISEFDISTLKMMACLGCADRRYARCSSDRQYDLKTAREFT